MAKNDDLRSWALKGAEQRLVEIADEARAIFMAFPELRAEGRGWNAPQGGAAVPSAPARTRRSRMSADARKAVSERMRAYWAARRAGNTSAAVAGEAAAQGEIPDRKAVAAAKPSPRTMSAEARQRISDAQKARWAKRRKGGAKAKAAAARKGGARKSRSRKTKK